MRNKGVWLPSKDRNQNPQHPKYPQTSKIKVDEAFNLSTLKLVMENK